MSARPRRIEKVLCEVFGGSHHVDWKRLKPQAFGQASYTVPDGILSTWDGDNLTRLVVSAHAHGVRVEVMNGGPRRVKLFLSERQNRDGTFYERHPTLAQHLKRLGEDPERDELVAEPEARP